MSARPGRLRAVCHGALLAGALALVACDETPAAPPGGFADTQDATDTTPEPDTLLVDTVVDTTPSGPVRPEHCTTKLSPGPAPLRRLTKTEYDNTVRDLLGDTSHPGQAFPPEEQTLGFDNNASGRGVAQVHVERYMIAAENLVRTALAERREQIIPCDPNDMPALLCARMTFSRFGKLAYRRPLTSEEEARYEAYFEALLPTEGFDGAIAMLLEVMLQSPHFLYRTELGEPDTDGDGVSALTGFELATRISYLLWGSMPDDKLLAAAEVGLLATPEGIATEARRLLKDPKARDALLHFHRQWLELPKLETTFKDADIFPDFAGLKDRFETETERFIDHVVWDGEGDLTTLLSASYSILDPVLADFYGATYPATESEGTPPERRGFTKVDLDPSQRAGLFTQASIMSTHAKYNQTSPVLRGKFVREQILCQPLQPPPANINITPPDLDPNLTTRERFRQHSDSDECAGCHKKMDPIGLTFEHYDGNGRWRDAESATLPIDVTGEILFTWDANGPVADALEVAHRLAESEQTRECYVTQWFRYAHGRDTGFADECNVFDLMQAFSASNWNIKELLVALTQTEAFRFRPTVVPGGGVGVGE